MLFLRRNPEEKGNYKTQLRESFMLCHIQNGKRIGLHLCLAPESKMLAVGVVGSLVDLCEPGNLSGDEVEDGELALANLAVDHP